MFQPCTICHNPELQQIDAALRRGEGLRPVAKQYSVSKSALSRHRERHLPAAVERKALEKVRVDLSEIPRKPPVVSPVPPHPVQPPAPQDQLINPRVPALGTIKELQRYYALRQGTTITAHD